MTVRLRARTSLLAGLVAMLGGIGGSGCVDEHSKSDLDSAGPPKVLQVFVYDPAESDDPNVGDYTLTYGVHPDVNRCSYDGTCGGDLTCATSGDVAGHCVDGSGSQPIAQETIVNGASIRIISKELLDGKTLEVFACACAGTEAGCPEGKDVSIDPKNCSACGDAAGTTVDETGQCLDVDHDTVPDASTLEAGVAMISCPTASMTFAYNTVRGDGYYYPSGNQFPTSTQGYGGIGPAIVLEPQVVLPTSADCSLTLTDKARDKDGNQFDNKGPFTFHTEGLAVAGTSPGRNAQNVPTDTAEIAIGFNAPLAEGSVSNASISMKECTAYDGDTGACTTTETDVTGFTVSVDGDTISVDLSGVTLKAGAKYTFTVATTVTDAYGQPLPGAFTRSFFTKAA